MFDAETVNQMERREYRLFFFRAIQIIGLLALLISHSVRLHILERDIHSLKTEKITTGSAVVEAEKPAGFFERFFATETAQEKDAKVPRVGQIRWTRMDLGFGKFYDATNTIVEVDSGHVKFADGMILGRYVFETCYGKPINCLNCGYTDK